jgi:hypothetical protein
MLVEMVDGGAAMRIGIGSDHAGFRYKQVDEEPEK